jgi:hypothetical protein
MSSLTALILAILLAAALLLLAPIAQRADAARAARMREANNPTTTNKKESIMFTSEAIEALRVATALAVQLRKEYENREAVLASHGPEANRIAAEVDLEARYVIARKLEYILPLSKQHGRDPEQSVDYLREFFLPRAQPAFADAKHQQIAAQVEEFEEDLFHLFDEPNYPLSAF